MKRFLTPGLLGLALLLFFLPFVNVYCNNELITQIKGIDLVMGSGGLQSGMIPQRGVKVEPVALLAFLAILLALVLTFFARPVMKLLAIIMNIFGAVLLFFLRSRILGRFRADQDLNNVTISFSLFYWLTVVVALAALLSYFYKPDPENRTGYPSCEKLSPPGN